MDARTQLYRFVFLLSLVALFPASVHAYIDAGTGSLIVQAVISVFVAVGFFARSFWSQIKKLFSGLLGRDKQTKKTK